MDKLQVVSKNNKFFSQDIPHEKNEVKVGTWIDGRPLYRKTIDFGYLSSGGEKAVKHNISNLDYITKIEGIAVSYTNTFPLPYVYTSLINVIALYATREEVIVTQSNSRSSYHAYIYLEYVKH